MENRRRLFLTEPGEPLILSHSAMSIVERFSNFAEYTGLDRSQIATNALVTQPFPILNRSSGPRGWPTTLNPAVMWHPLFWLPERVALRYRFDDENGIETEDEWVVRLGLELTMSELYNPTDGSWFDVLAFHDLDSEDPAVQQRLRNWLAGADDQALDSIDLTDVIDMPGNEHWAVESAAEILPALLPASWAVLANDLAQVTGSLITEDLDRDDAIEAAETLVNLALGTLFDVPAAGAGEPAPHVRWQEIARSLSDYQGDLDQLLAGELDELGESFYAIRDDYWKFVDLLNEEIASSQG